MKKLITALTVVAATLWAAAPAQAEVDVGVSISISQPGVYGRVDIGQFPQPRVVVAQPVWVVPAPQRVRPVYMWVPPGHRKNWKKHCSDYGACGAPVYFVDHRWYDNNVRKAGPYYRAERADDRRDDRRDGRRDWRDDRRDDRYDQRGNGKGNGHGKGHGNGKGRGD